MRKRFLTGGQILKSALDVAPLAASLFPATAPFAPLISGVGSIAESAFDLSGDRRMALDRQRKMKADIAKQNRLNELRIGEQELNLTPQEGFETNTLFRFGGKMSKFGNLNINANGRRIGNGMQISTNKKGTDKIKASIGGRSIKLDNNEIIIKDENGNPTVLSDDLGEAGRYKDAVKKGYNPAILDKVFSKRAEQIRSRLDGDRFQFGGRLLNSGSFNDSVINSLPYRVPTLPKVNPLQYNTVEGQIVADPNSPIGENIPSTFRRIGNRINAEVGDFANRAGDFLSDPDNATAVGNVLTGASTLINNRRLAKDFENLEAPEMETINPTLINRNSVRAPFNRARSEVRSGGARLSNAIEKMSGSTTQAMSRLGDIRAKELSAASDIASQEAQALSNVDQANIRAINEANRLNANIISQNNMAKYQNELANLTRRGQLNAATTATIQGFLDNVSKGRYQKDQLAAIAKSYNLNITGTESVDEIVDAIVKQQIKDQIGG